MCIQHRIFNGKAVEGKYWPSAREEVVGYSGYFTGGEWSGAWRSTLSCLNTSDNLNDKTLHSSLLPDTDTPNSLQRSLNLVFRGCLRQSWEE